MFLLFSGTDCTSPGIRNISEKVSDLKPEYDTVPTSTTAYKPTCSTINPPRAAALAELLRAINDTTPEEREYLTKTTPEERNISRKVSEPATSPSLNTPTNSTSDDPNSAALTELLRVIRKIEKLSFRDDVPSTSNKLPSTTTNTTTVTPSPPVKNEHATETTTPLVTKNDFESFKKEMLDITKSNSERFPVPTQSMPGTLKKKKHFLLLYFLYTNYYLFLPTPGSIISYQKNIHSPYNHPMYENTPIVPITPYHVPYVPSFHHTVPSTQHHPTVSTQLPNVNEALSKVENDLQSLNDTLSHPHTINDPISFIRASQISSQVQKLNKKCPLLKSTHKCPQVVCSVRDLVLPSSNQPKMSPFLRTLFLPQTFVPSSPNQPTRTIAQVL